MFNSIEDSFLRQIRELDERSLDNVKIINDVRKIISFSELSEKETKDDIRSSFLSLSVAIEKLTSNYNKLESHYQEALRLSQRNLKKIETAINSLVDLTKGGEKSFLASAYIR